MTHIEINKETDWCIDKSGELLHCICTSFTCTLLNLIYYWLKRYIKHVYHLWNSTTIVPLSSCQVTLDKGHTRTYVNIVHMQTQIKALQMGLGGRDFIQPKFLLMFSQTTPAFGSDRSVQLKQTAGKFPKIQI